MTNELQKRHKLHALCPYFAMFPPEFARDSVSAHTKPGDLVLDPFSGRGTTLLEALLLGRDAIALDVNPVAYCVTTAKARVPSLSAVLCEIEILEHRFEARGERSRSSMLPEFFRYAFHSRTLKQLIFLREALKWKQSSVHCFLAALTLGHLHGEANRSQYYCSNQMPHSISTKPDYSVRYWKKHRLSPPARSVFDILRDRAVFRLKGGSPERRGRTALADVRNASRSFTASRNKVSAVVTSPPYLDVTNFAEDQWLRLWFLGGPPKPTYGCISHDDRHSASVPYWQFIRDAWNGIAPLLRKNATLVCRIGAKGVTPELLTKTLTTVTRAVWPKAVLICEPVQSKVKNSQISVLNPRAHGCRYELDLTFALR